MRSRNLVVLGVAAGIVCGAGVAGAQQQPIPQRLEAAKQEIINLNPDGAATLIQSVLVNTSGASGSQRAWAYALMAVTRLAAQDRNGAQRMFSFALNQDPRLPGDSLPVLRDLDSQAEAVYQQALTLFRGATGVVVAPRDSLRLDFTVRDTILASTDSSLSVIPRPSRRAKTVVTVAAVGATAGSILAISDTLPPGATAPLAVKVRRADGRPVLQPAQSYVFTLTAVDSFGVRAQRRWTMRLDTLPPVAQPLPEPLAASALRPETTEVRSRSAASLVTGIGLGAAAALLPTVLGQSKLNSGLAGDATAYVVAGSVTAAGIAGYLGGRRAQFQPENARYNENLRREYERRLAAVRTANEQARQRPRIRLQIVPETNR